MTSDDDGMSQMRIVFSAHMELVRPLRHFIGSLCSVMEYDEEEADSIALVATEAINSAIEDRSQGDRVALRVTVGRGVFRLEIEDRGGDGESLLFEA